MRDDPRVVLDAGERGVDDGLDGRGGDMTVLHDLVKCFREELRVLRAGLTRFPTNLRRVSGALSCTLDRPQNSSHRAQTDVRGNLRDINRFDGTLNLEPLANLSQITQTGAVSRFEAARRAKAHRPR